MTPWEKLRRRLGGLGIAIIVGTTLLATLLAALAAPRLVTGSAQAEGQVSMAQITGTRAAFEIATYVADFQSAATSVPAREASAAAAGIPVSDVAVAAIAERQGDSTNVRVTFDADSPTAAESGLRVLVHEALGAMVEDARRRASIELAGARERQLTLVDRFSEPGATDQAVPAELRERALELSVERAAQDVADAELAAAIVEAEARAAPEYASSLVVSVTSLPTTAEVLRVVLAAGATSLVLATGGVLLSVHRGVLRVTPLRKASVVPDGETRVGPAHRDPDEPGSGGDGTALRSEPADADAPGGAG